MEEYRQHSKTSQSIDIENDEIDLVLLLSDMWKGFKKLWWLVALLAVLLANIVFVYSIVTYVPQYQAKATFTISTQSTASTGAAGLTNYGYDYNTSTAAQMAKTFPYILQSDLMQEIVAQELGVTEVNGEVTAETTTNTNLFTVIVTSDSATDAYEILQSLIDNYHKVADYVIGDTQVNILSSPVVPDKPVNARNYLRNTMLAFFIGIFLGICLILVYALLRNTIRREEDLREKLNMQCLGTVPTVSFKKRSRNNNTISILNKYTGTAFQESIRSLRTRVLRHCEEGKKILIVTSTLPGEGKTTVSVNLALSIAQRDKKVVLVDCDLRNPSIAKILCSGRETFGLKEVLEGEKKLEEAVILLENEGVYLLAGQSSVSNPIGMFGSEQMKVILKQLEDFADYVILDTSPCGIFADTASIAGYADYGLFVVKEDYADLFRIRESIQSLSDSGVVLLGSVLNGVESGFGNYGDKYGKYGRYGRYGNYSYI